MQFSLERYALTNLFINKHFGTVQVLRLNVSGKITFIAKPNIICSVHWMLSP